MENYEDMKHLVPSLQERHLFDLEEQLLKMNSTEQNKVEEYSQSIDFWEAFIKCGYGQIAAFIAMTKEACCSSKRKQTLIYDMYRYSQAYKDMGYKFINKQLFSKTLKIAKSF